MKHFAKALTLAAGIFALPVAVAPSYAVDYSGQTITMIVPFSEGGGTDRLARLLTSKLSAYLPGNPNVIVLNRPGGGSVTAANAFHNERTTDGTVVFLGGTSTFLPVMLRANIANFDPNEWVAIVGFPRGAMMYGRADVLGLDDDFGEDAVADLEALRDADIRFGLETPIAAEMLDLVALDLLEVDPRVIFGLSSSNAQAAFLRGEMTLNTDSTLSYVANFTNDDTVVPVWTYGIVSEGGDLLRDPDLETVPTFAEFYQTASGQAPSGPGYELLEHLMFAKVMLSKALFLPRDAADDVREVYVEAFMQLVEDPEVAAALRLEVGTIPLTFGDETTRSLAGGTQMSDDVRDWANDFLRSNYDASLD